MKNKVSTVPVELAYSKDFFPKYNLTYARNVPNGILCLYTPVLVCNEMKSSLNIIKIEINFSIAVKK